MQVAPLTRSDPQHSANHTDLSTRLGTTDYPTNFKFDLVADFQLRALRAIAPWIKYTPESAAEAEDMLRDLQGEVDE